VAAGLLLSDTCSGCVVVASWKWRISLLYHHCAFHHRLNALERKQLNDDLG
jgi:hypothetical protein